ncbi:MAG: DAK2 domain-containing protein [Clostridia bacterium]|nr:DAK2 domain-containing protein [Clostridia bacterium]
MRKTLTGTMYEKMVRNGLVNLGNSVRYINDLNVFPVPDGDTGINMYHTLRNGIEKSKSDKDLGDYLASLSRQMLFNARGNSGVILSQLFKGFADCLRGEDEVGVSDLVDALTVSYRTAYAALSNPVEGTLLTVAREGIENIRDRIDRRTTVTELFEMFLEEIKASVKRTPDMLPILKEAGVIDSGGMGYVCIVEGMVKALRGEEVADNSGLANTHAASDVDTSAFDQDSSLDYGYCMEFLLQLMNARRPVENFDYNAFTKALDEHGDSIVAVKDGSRVKVHIHTKKPAGVIVLAQKYGEFVDFKLENMQLQHNSIYPATKVRKERVPLAVVAVSNAPGVTELYRSFYHCIVLDADEKMNVSCQDFVNAFENANADRIAVLPNNKNLIRAAEQAAGLSEGGETVSVIPTCNSVQGYFTLSMDCCDGATPEERVEMLKEAAENVTTISVAPIVRDCMINGRACKAGDHLALINNEASSCEPEALQAPVSALAQVEDMDDKAQITLFGGTEVSEEMGESLREAVEEAYPDLEVMYVNGGQPLHTLIAGIL